MATTSRVTDVMCMSRVFMAPPLTTDLVLLVLFGMILKIDANGSRRHAHNAKVSCYSQSPLYKLTKQAGRQADSILSYTFKTLLSRETSEIIFYLVGQ